MNPITRLFRPAQPNPDQGDQQTYVDSSSQTSSGNAFFRRVEQSSVDGGTGLGIGADADFQAGFGSDFGGGSGSGSTANFGDIDAGLAGGSSGNPDSSISSILAQLNGGTSNGNVGSSSETSSSILAQLNGGTSDGDVGSGSETSSSILAQLNGGTSDGNVDSGSETSGSILAQLNAGTSDGNIDSGSDNGNAGSDYVDNAGNTNNSVNNASQDVGTQPLSLETSPFQGAGAPGDLQGFNRRPYSKNAEGMFATAFDPKNATAGPNGSMNIHMQGNAGAEITAAHDATAYGSYTATTKSQDVHGANQTGFFYGDGRKFEVDLFEPALQHGDVNTFTSGMWLDNVKVAETNVKASDLGFKSFHDQPMTYKMDFSPGNIKISALNSKGAWQTIVNHSDPRINDQLARDTHFKQMFSVWGVSGEYKGAPVDFQVLKTGYSAHTV